MVQKKLIGKDERFAYYCEFCNTSFVVTLAEWRRHCKTHAEFKALQRAAHQNYKIWKAGGFR